MGPDILRRSGSAAAIAILLVVAALWLGPASPATWRGFDLSNLTIPREELLPGGPPKDGIPALTDPALLPAPAASYLRDDDRVLGLVVGGEARAYPLAILNWHEVVNERIGGQHVVVTYCPLCYSGMAFRADFDGKRQVFGVSGLLYNSDVVLYDRQTESLWSQLLGRAISGPHADRRLEPLPLTHTTWADWRRRHPDTRVLSPETGYRRDYDRDPYAQYAQSRHLAFPVAFRAQGFHPKQRMLGLELGGEARAWPFSELARAGGEVTERVGGVEVSIRYDERSESAVAVDASGELLPGVTVYWFAWYAFHPDTQVFRAPRAP